MNRMKKTAAALVCAVICVCLLLGAADCRAKEAEKKELVTVADDAGILMEEEADWLKDTAGKLSEKSNWSVIVATCNDAGGKTAQTVCEEYYNRYAAGDDGISCLVDLDNREIYLATAGKAQRFLTDERLDDLLDKAHAAAEKEDYTQALYLMLIESDQAYEKGVPREEKTVDKKNGLMGTVSNVLLLVVVAGGGFVAGKMIRGRRKSAQVRNYRRPPNAARRSATKSTNRSSAHKGAGGRKFGGKGRKF